MYPKSLSGEYDSELYFIILVCLSIVRSKKRRNDNFRIIYQICQNYQLFLLIFNLVLLSFKDFIKFILIIQVYVLFVYYFYFV